MHATEPQPMPQPTSPPVPHAQDDTARKLLRWGVLLFLVGLLVGFAVPALKNPRMGLASHLEGVMNGLFLMVLGLIWPRLHLTAGQLRATYGLAVFGTFANVLATFLAAAWGAGGMMPIAGQGQSGTALQETVVKALLGSLAVAMVAVCVLLLVGLRRPRPSR